MKHSLYVTALLFFVKFEYLWKCWLIGKKQLGVRFEFLIRKWQTCWHHPLLDRFPARRQILKLVRRLWWNYSAARNRSTSEKGFVLFSTLEDPFLLERETFFGIFGVGIAAHNAPLWLNSYFLGWTDRSAARERSDHLRHNFWPKSRIFSKNTSKILSWNLFRFSKTRIKRL